MKKAKMKKSLFGQVNKSNKQEKPQAGGATRGDAMVSHVGNKVRFN